MHQQAITDAITTLSDVHAAYVTAGTAAATATAAVEAAQAPPPVGA